MSVVVRLGSSVRLPVYLLVRRPVIICSFPIFLNFYLGVPCISTSRTQCLAGTQSEDPPSGSATFGLDVSLWPRATFDLSVNTGPMLDVRKLKELPERQSVSTVDVLHKRLVQMMVDCAVRPEQVFWLIPGGTSALEVTCPTSSDKLLRRKLRSCGSMAALRRYMESLLVNIRCSPKFVRIGDQSVGNQTIKTPSRKIGTNLQLLFLCSCLSGYSGSYQRQFRRDERG